MVLKPNKTKDTHMSDVSIATPIAPSHPGGVGTAKPGGHIAAFRAQSAFPVEATLTVTGGNLWRPGTPGHRFYEEVLGLGTVQTVQECIDKAGALAEPINAKQVQGHLRWMFTSSGNLLEVDGQKFAAEPKVVKPTVKPVKVAKPKKVKAEAEAA
jgi:hypothetical protein